MSRIVFERDYRLGVAPEPALVCYAERAIDERHIEKHDGQLFLRLSDGFLVPARPPKFYVRELRSRARPWFGQRRRPPQPERIGMLDLGPPLMRELYEADCAAARGEDSTAAAAQRLDNFTGIPPETPHELAHLLIRAMKAARGLP